MIHRLIAYSLILLGIIGTLYMGLEGLYGDRYDTPSVSMDQLNDMLQDTLPIVLIDVRTHGEITAQPGPWPEAISIPLLDLEARMPELIPSRSRQLITLCPTGKRSREAARVLHMNGFRARYLDKGMFQNEVVEK